MGEKFQLHLTLRNEQLLNSCTIHWWTTIVGSVGPQHISYSNNLHLSICLSSIFHRYKDLQNFYFLS